MSYSATYQTYIWDYNYEILQSFWDYFRLTKVGINDLIGEPSQELLDRHPSLIELGIEVFKYKQVYDIFASYFEGLIRKESGYINIVTNVRSEACMYIQKYGKRVCISGYSFDGQIDLFGSELDYQKQVGVEVGDGITTHPILNEQVKNYFTSATAPKSLVP